MNSRFRQLSVSALVVVALVSLASLVGVAQAQVPVQTPVPPAGYRTIEVTGNGQTTVEPDQAMVALGVETDAANASQALAQNNQQMQSLLNALQQAGVSKADIQTQLVQLQPKRQPPVTPQQSTGQEGQPEITGYTATNVVQVRVRSLDQLGALIDAAVGAGANQVQGIDFVVSNPSQATDQAVQAAWQDARRQAEQLATLAGGELGLVLQVRQTSASPLPRGGVAFAAEAAAVPIAPGSQEVQASVDVTWELLGGQAPGTAGASPETLGQETSTAVAPTRTPALAPTSAMTSTGAGLAATSTTVPTPTLSQPAIGTMTPVPTSGASGAAVQTTVPGLSASPTATLTTGPGIVLSPDRGGPNTPVQLTGSNFPPSTQIYLYIVRPGGQPGQESYGRVRSGALGNISGFLIMPDQWPGGEPISTGPVRLVAATRDMSASAEATFEYTSAGSQPAAASGASASSGTPGAAQTPSVGQSFLAQVSAIDQYKRQITLVDGPGSDVVQLTGNTQIIDSNAQTRMLSDIAPGRMIAVEASGASAGVLNASRILILDASTRLAIPAVVQQIFPAERLLTFKPELRGFAQFQLTPDAEIRDASGKDRTIEDIAPGMKILAAGRAGAPGTLLVDSVTLLPSSQTRTGGATPTPQPGSAAGLPVTGWQRMAIPELGLAFEIPEGWQRLGTEWTWAAPGPGAPRLGIDWQDISQQNWQPEQLLPPASNILVRRVELLGVVRATRFVVQAPVRPSDPAAQPFQTHLILRVGNRAYDAFALARSREELTQLDGVLAHVLSSVQFTSATQPAGSGS